jgi:hypothetical protein
VKHGQRSGWRNPWKKLLISSLYVSNKIEIPLLDLESGCSRHSRRGLVVVVGNRKHHSETLSDRADASGFLHKTATRKSLLEVQGHGHGTQAY